VALDGAGNLVIADSYNNRIRVVAARTGTFYGQAMTAGHIYTVAGDGHQGNTGNGGPATSAGLYRADSVVVDAAGNLVIPAATEVRVVAAASGTFYGQAMTAGDIYSVAGNGTAGDSGNGGPATSAEMDGPLGVAVDSAGNLVITDSGNSRIRVVAATTGTFYGLAMTADDIYTVAGDGVLGYSGDGGPATNAGVPAPASVIVNHAGNLLFTDLSGRVRTVTG
jgi:NHL repeat